MEQWKDVPGFEGRYQVSDCGNVRSVNRTVRAVAKNGSEYARRVAGVVLKPGNCRGYRIVNLHPNGTIAVHLLVARAFIEQTAGEVNHKDGDKTNNAAANLEWVSKRENQLHAVAVGLKPQAMVVTSPSGKTYPSIAQAAKAERVNHRTAAKWVTP